MALLSLSDIKKSFGATVALDGVSLELGKGEVHALIGENGAGKSTLMNVLAGAVRPDSGALEFDAQPYVPSTPSEARHKGFALIHQELSLCPHLSVAENILMGLETTRLGWLDRKRLRSRSLEVLDSFDHREIRPETRVGSLPVAAQQIIEICRAVAARARVILMDEPTSSLQRDDVRKLFGLIRKLRSEGISVIYISHFLEEVREIADTFTVLRDGKSVSTGRISSVTDEDLIGQMVGRSIEALFPSRIPYTSGEEILEVRDLSAPPMVKNASFTLRRGEVLGIAGLMGSGRTEAVRAIFGLDKPASGSIKINGKKGSARAGSPSVRLSEGLGFLSEDRKGEGLALSLSVADNITATHFSTCARWGWLNLSQQRKQASGVARALGVKANTVDQPVSTLSGGNQQKVALARLVHQDADILLLDEPTRGIDIGSKAQVYEAIGRCAAEGKAVLLVSSYLPELFGMCDRLAVMSRGRLSEARPISDWTPESVLQMAIAQSG
jgi:ribose transport system ATP-binding protein